MFLALVDAVHFATAGVFGNASKFQKEIESFWSSHNSILKSVFSVYVEYTPAFPRTYFNISIFNAIT